MLKMKKPAFTLIEMLVVIAIVVLTSGFGFVSYFRLHDRQRVENTAKEIITYLREMQNNARIGARGSIGSDCNPTDVTNRVANGERALLGWRTDIRVDSLSSRAICEYSLSGTGGGGARPEPRNGIGYGNWGKKIDLPDGFELLCPYASLTRESDILSHTCNSVVIKYDPLFGDTEVFDIGRILASNPMDSDQEELMIARDENNRGEKTQVFILRDKGRNYNYRFAIKNGAITSGCWCDGITLLDCYNKDC